MKRKVLLVVMCMTLLLSGCDKKLKEEDYIGTWKTEEYVSKENNATYIRTLEVYKGGAGKIISYNVTEDEIANEMAMSWTLVEDNEILSMETQLLGTYGFEYDKENNTLIQQDEDLVFTKQ